MIGPRWHDRSERSKRLHYFHQLTRDQQAASIRRLAAEGYADSTISQATGLSVEMVRQVIGPRRSSTQ